MSGDGGTPSVWPASVATYAGRPPTKTFGDHEPGNVATTVVHGFVVGVGGCAQPTIGAPFRSGTHITGPPWMSTTPCRGMSITCPPCAHVMTAREVRMRVTCRPVAYAKPFELVSDVRTGVTFLPVAHRQGEPWAT